MKNFQHYLPHDRSATGAREASMNHDKRYFRNVAFHSIGHRSGYKNLLHALYRDRNSFIVDSCHRPLGTYRTVDVFGGPTSQIQKEEG